jgi:hypothetical protein
MTMEEWRGRLNQLMYGMLHRPLDERSVDEIASLVAGRRVLTAGAQNYARAIRDALAAGVPLNDDIGTPHTEQQLRNFLARLATRLEAQSST